MTAPSPFTSISLADALLHLAQQHGVSSRGLTQLKQLFAAFLASDASADGWSIESLESFLEQSPAGLEATEQYRSVLREFVQQFSIHQVQVALTKFLLALKSNDCSKATIRNYRSDINQFFAFCQTDDIREALSQSRISDFGRYQSEKGLLPSSIRRKNSSINLFLEWCVSQGLLVATPSIIQAEVQPITQPAPTPLLAFTPAASSEISRPANPPETADSRQQPMLDSVKTSNTLTPEDSLLEKKLAQTFSTYNQNIKRRFFPAWLGYLNILVLLVVMLGLGVFGYRQFFRDLPKPLAYPSTPVTPNRVLSFQGRLSDTAQNPITSATNFTFRLYTAVSGGTLLWNSGTCSITPDQDGIFNTQLGDTCGSAIASSVFSENQDVWLEVQVASETLTPRQPIATVPYALNSETLQGYPISATGAATVNTVLTMDGGGSVVLGEVNPEIRALSGTFTLEGQSLTFQTSSGSNGNIVLDADGIGGVISRDYIHAPGATLSATYAGGVPLTLQGGPSGTGNLLTLNNSTGTNLSYFASDGTLTVSQNSGYTSTLYSNTLSFSRNAQNYITAANASGSLIFRTGGSNDRLTISSAGNFDFATGTTAFNGITYTWPGSQSAGYILSTNGSGTLSWTDPALAGAASIFWSQSNGALYPKNSTVDVLIGGQASDSADFAFLNVNSGTPVASFSGWLTFNSAGRIGTTNNQSLSLNGSGGNVGVGTVNPAYGLDTWSQGTNIARFRLSGGAELLINSTSTPGAGSISLTSDDTTTSGLSFSTRNAAGTGVRMVINNNGYIGINTTSPLGTLDTRAQSGTLSVASFSGQTAFATLVADNSGVGDIFTASSSGLNRFVIKQNGNVGVGTTTPTSKLHVYGPTDASSLSVSLDATGHQDNNSTLRILAGNASGRSEIFLGDTNNNSIGSIVYNQATNAMSFATNASTAMTILSSGYVGIGSTNPLFPLDIAGQTRSNSFLGANNGSPATVVFGVGGENDTGMYGVTSNTLNFATNGVERVRITSQGDFGIGTTAPIAKFQVHGAPGAGGNALAIFNQTNSDDILAASASGTNQFVLSNAGNLGLGTTIPDTTGGASSYTKVVEIESSGNPVLRFDHNDATSASEIGIVSFGRLSDALVELAGVTDGAIDAGYLSFRTQATGGGITERMRLTSDGNLRLNAQGDLRLADADSSNYAAIQSPATLAGNYTLTLPDDDGATGQALVTDGSGVLSWSTVATLSNVLWFQNNGALYPANSTVDLLIGGQATTSANFAFINNSGSGTPTASFSGNLTLNSAGTIATTLNRNLSINPTGGWVGIGTTTPGAALDIQSAISGEQLEVRNPSGTISYISITASDTGAGTSNGFTVGYNNGAQLNNRENTDMVLATNGTERFRILNSGLIGIGTSNPLSTLDTRSQSGTRSVASFSGQTAFATLVADNSGVGDIFSASSSGLNRFVITQSGRVGIGTATPGELLSLDSALYDPSISIQSRVNPGSATNNFLKVYNGVGGERVRFSYDQSGVVFGIAVGTTLTTPHLAIEGQQGFVGLGTTVPRARLDIAGSASTSGTLAFSGTTDPKIDVLNGEAFGIRTSPGGDTGLTERFTVLNSGNVGIGTTTATGLLHVGSAVSTANQNLYVDAANAYNSSLALASAGTAEWLLYRPANTTDFRIFEVGGDDRFSIEAGGNIGIGTTNPNNALELGAGNFQINAQGDLRLADADSSAYAAIQSPATLGASYTLTLPDDDGATGQALVTDGNGLLSWSTVATLSNVLWFQNNGALYPANSTVDLLIGGQSTASARFAVTNVNSGATTATISGTTAGYAMSLDGDGTVATSLNRTLSLNPNGGNVAIGTTSPATGAKLDVNGNLRLPSTGILGFGATSATGLAGPTIYFGTTTSSAGQVAIGLNGGSGNGANSGLFFPSRDTIAFSASSTELMRIGNGFGVRTVGIGTTSPLSTFDVRSQSGTLSVASFSGQTSFATLVTDNSGVGDIFTASSSGLNRFVIKQGGNVGIGTPTPAGKLELSSSEALNLFVTDTSGARAWVNAGTSNTLFGSYTNHRTGLTVNGTEYLSIISGGNVGIGTTVPSQALHVVGNTYIDTSAGELTIQNTGSASVELLSSGSLVLDTAAANSIGFQIGNTTLGTFFNSNFGLGDTSPAALLTVGNGDLFQVNSAGVIAAIEGVGHIIDDDSGNLRLTSNSNQITLNENVFLPTQNDLQFADSDSSNYAAIQAPATLAGNYTLTLPDDDGASGQVLATDGSGVLSWTSAATLSNIFWYQTNGALYPANSTVDLLVGGQATTSARFSVTNVNGVGNVTASISGSVTNSALSLTGNGTIATTLNRSLIINPSGGNVAIGTTAPISALSFGDNTPNSPVSRFAVSEDASGQFFYGIGLAGPGANEGLGLWGGTEATNPYDGSSGTQPHVFIERSTGYMGVGTTNPADSVHVYGTDRGLVTENSGNGNFGRLMSGTNASVFFFNDNNQFWIRGTSTTTDAGGTGLINMRVYGNDSANANDIDFNEGQLYLDQTSDNVGVGDTSPAALFTVGNGDLFQINTSGIIATIDGVAHTIEDVGGNLRLSSNSTTIEVNDNVEFLAQSDVRLVDSDNTNYAAIQAPSNVGTNYTLTLPADDGAANQALVTDGSGVLSWVDNSAWWNQTNGALYPYNSTVDVLFGGQASSSANFAFINNSGSGTPTASISGNITLNSAGVIATTNQRTLTIGDANTGNLSFVSDGTTAMTILPGGNIGVGTTTASNVLSVNGNIQLTGTGNAIRDFNNNNILSNSSGTLTLGNTGTNVATVISRGASTPFSINRSATTDLYISAAGNVGINTTNPGAKFNVVGDGGSAVSALIQGDSAQTGDLLQVTSSDGIIEYFSINPGTGVVLNEAGIPAMDVRIESDNDPNLFFTDAGTDRVGIGTNAPAALFSIGSSSQFQINTSGIIAAIDGIAHTIEDVSGNLQLTSNSTQITFNDNVFLPAQSDLQLADSDSSNYAAIQAPATIGTNYTLTLPDTDGNSGEVLTSDGSGVLSWTTVASTTNLFWAQSSGALYPANSTVDVLFGGQASSSANFAFLNNSGSGTPTASISGNLTLNSAGVLATTNQRTLTLGDANTGNLSFVSDGTTAMTILPGGNIGIGTTSLVGRLNVLSSGTTPAIFVRSTANNDPIPALAITAIPEEITTQVSGSNNRGLMRISAGGGSNLEYKTAIDLQGFGATDTPQIRFYTAGTENVRINNLGNVAIGTTAPLADLHVVGNYGSNAALIVDQTNSGDIVTASVSGATRFRIDTNGYTHAQRFSDLANSAYFLDPAATGTSLATAGDIGINTTAPSARIHAISTTEQLRLGYDASNYTQFTTGVSGDMTIVPSGGDLTLTGNLNVSGTTTFNSLAYTWPASQTAGYVLQTNGSGTLSWVNPLTSFGAYWQVANGALAPINSTLDVLIGGTASSSADFAFINVNSGTPTASFSGNLTFNSAGVIQSVANQTLTIGGNSTGNIILNPGNGSSRVGINTTLPSSALDVSGTASISSTLTMGGAIRPSTGNLSLQYKSGLNAWTTGMTLDTVGNLGIGTTAPGYALHLQKSNIRATMMFRTLAAGDPYAEFNMSNYDGGQSSLIFSHNDGASELGNLWQLTSADDTDTFTFHNWTLDAPLMRFDNASNRVLFGNNTNSFLGLLHLETMGTNVPAFGKAVLSINQIETNGDLFTASASGTTRFVIKNTGYVGMNTTLPASPLDIDTASNTLGLRLRGLAETTEISDMYVGSAGELIISNTAGADTAQFIDLRPEDNDYGLILRNSSGASTTQFANFYVNDAATDYLNMVVNNTNSSTGLVLASSGSVGIGTTNPSRTLHVYGVNVGVSVQDSSAGGHSYVLTNNSTGDGSLGLYDATSTTFRWLVTSGGLMGINTTSPGSLLNVMETNATSSNGTAFGFNNDSLSASGGIGVISTDDAATNGEYFLVMRSEQDSTPDNEFLFTTDGRGLADTSWTTPATDFAENYKVLGSAEPGDLVSIPITSIANSGKSVQKSAGEQYDKSVLGIISTSPGFVGGYIDPEDPDIAAYQPIALTGRVPVKVNLENGPIQAGDPLTSSSQPGVAMKATQAGRIIGYALESYDGSFSRSRETIDVENKRLGLTPDNQPLPLPQPGTGKIVAFVNPNYFDPSLKITSNGFVTIAGNDNAPIATATYTASAGSELLTKVDAFAELAVANLKAGIVRTRQLLAEVRIQTPEVQTDLITPINDTVSVKLGDANDQFQVTNAQNQPVATIDAEGNTDLAGNLNVAGTTQLGSLLAETASISGDATISGQLNATSARISTLEAHMAELDSVRAQTAELVNATVSGTLYANNIDGFDDKIASALEQPSLLAKFLDQQSEATASASVASVFNIIDQAGYTASGAASLNRSLEDLQLGNDEVAIGASAVFINKYFEVNGSGFIAQDLGIGNSLLIGQGMHIADGSINYQPAGVDSPTLQIQGSGHGTINLLAGAMTISENGLVNITGDLVVGGKVTVEDTLLTDMLRPTDFGNPFQVQVAGVATESGQVKESRFEIVNELGAPVATISAQGKATFAGGIGVGSQDLSGSENQAETTKTSGKAVVKQGQTEMVIKSEKLTTDSVVQVTPLGSTNNQVLYVKSVTAENPNTTDKEGQFVVGFDTALPDRDVQFTWWILN